MCVGEGGGEREEREQVSYIPIYRMIIMLIFAYVRHFYLHLLLLYVCESVRACVCVCMCIT